MKNLILILFFCISLFGQTQVQTPKDIISQIPKTSKDYSLDKTLFDKINELKFKPSVFEINKTKQPFEYADNFLHLSKLLEQLNTIPKQISSMQDKIDILQNSSNPTDKLQVFYYKKYIQILNKQLNYLQNNFKEWENRLFEQLKVINIDTNLIKQNIVYWDKLLKKKKIEYTKLNINLQKWQLLGDNANLQQTKMYIELNLKKQKQIYDKLLQNQLILWLNALQNKNKIAFSLDDKIFEYSKQIDSSFYKAINKIVIDFESNVFGSAMLIYGAKNEFQLLLEKIWNVLNYPLFQVSKRSITLLNFLLFFIVFILGVVVGKYYKKFIYNLRHTKNISYSTATLLANMGYYIILSISFLISLKVVGLDLGSLAIVAGALSVGIGFGLQNIVSNFVSGIIMMFEKTIKVGDYIEIDNDTRGEVVDISMRSTIIKTNDNINLIIPNQSFIQNNVINWTLGDDIVRFRVPFGVAYGSDIDEVERVILQALSENDLPYVKNKFGDYEIRVVFESMGDSSLNFELFVWVRGDYARRPRRTRSEFLKVIYNALNKAGITIPFPQTDLHIVDSVPIEVQIKGQKNVE